MRDLNGSGSAERREKFGYSVMGPILADMLRQLLACLNASRQQEAPVVFFCARGGLMLRHTLELFTRRIGVEIPVRCEDFMVSRLAAARTALQTHPAAVAPLIEQEFAGRTCAQAAQALANVNAGTDSAWNRPFTVVKWLELTTATEMGRRIRAINDEHAELLRRHIDALRGPSERVTLCDTGVFGSIAQYLHIGVPTIDWRSILLFRANYKHIAAPHFEYTQGIVSESDAYLPWRPSTAVLLYWQLMEAFLEPALSTVRYYHINPVGRVVSELELGKSQGALSLPPGSMIAGACAYLGDLTPGSTASIRHRARSAWRRLRRMIVFPTQKDVELLAVGHRTLDFGIDESAEFTSSVNHTASSLRGKLSAARNSMWPEGELRKQFPNMAGVVLFGWELGRVLRALQRHFVSAENA